LTFDFLMCIFPIEFKKGVNKMIKQKDKRILQGGKYYKLESSAVVEYMKE